MIEGLKPYPEYKDSGLPWLGRIPSHWKLERAKGLFLKMDRPSRTEDEVVTCFRDGMVTLRKNRRLRGFTESLKEIGYQGVRRGELVIHAMDAFAGAVGVSDSDGKCTPVYAVCKPRRELNPHYYSYVIREMARTQWIASLAKGIRERSTDFRFDGFASQPVPFPALTEQNAIAIFFNHANRRIERYIRAKRKLIALLMEHKQAIVHRAVTRGLDPNVRVKTSGVPGLGDIPEHWEIRKLGHIARVFNGTTPSRMQPRYWMNGSVAWVSSGKVNDYVVREPSELISLEAFNDCSLEMAPRGSVILGMVGQGRTRGMSALLEIDACINQNLAAIVPKDGLSGRFLHYVLTGFYRHIREFGRGGNQEALNCEIVGSLRLPLPPEGEQLIIVDSLNAELLQVNEAITRTDREIVLIREYRTRLVADVATGQLDVRDAAAKLPDESVELESFDDFEGLSEEQDISSDTSLDAESAETEL